ncbi:endonuclease/exonuclease/phosphatase family protein [uncultured Winogradskyella sp.]|uniref:endonuclease/exonuclease/phosphatase family protein n=1 Tax=uncultured Winogradskyella sp. TaxID=395353 RepID=UPI00263196D8|nr:endonuclease/exonuclease/phosphatase family protein [uncultured Winogradskyella sp.]
MKILKFFIKLMFLANSLAAFLLLISYVLPYIPPKSYGTLSVISLGVPLLIILNILFFIYWLLRVKKQMLLSLIVLLLGWNYLGAMYQFSSSKSIENSDNFSVMSFNVRMFNKYNWKPNKTTKQDIIDFFYKEAPDVICIQEYTRGKPIKLDGYNDYNARYTKSVRGGHTIFSKFPIINSGSLEFENTNNNAVFADVVKGKDTIRVYNLHLQSSKVNTQIDYVNSQYSRDMFLKRVKAAFIKQQSQVELVLQHKAKCTYKTIIAGDFNNTSFSYSYKEILGDDMLDTFKEAGNGFGKTFDFKFFPLRIDFILAHKDFKVNGFKTYDDTILSDHYPIMATLKLN